MSKLTFGKKLLVVFFAFNFKKDIKIYKDLIYNSLFNLNKIPHDFLFINTNDNKLFEVYKNFNKKELFSSEINFLEFQGLLYALENYSKNYTKLLYLNSSIFQKHILKIINKSLKNDSEIINKIEKPAIIGRVDNIKINYFGNNYLLINYVSSFYFFLNKYSMNTVKEILKKDISENKYIDKITIKILKEFCLMRINKFNRNYMNLDNNLRNLKIKSSIIEKEISISIEKQGLVINSNFLSRKYVLILEFTKNFLIKRFPFVKDLLMKL